MSLVPVVPVKNTRSAMGNNPDAIVGHSFQIEQLQSDLESDNLAHAYLFAGPRHVGKMTIAKWFAKQILSLGTSPESAKRVDQDVDNLLHPDFLVLDQLWMKDTQEDWDVIAQTSNVPQQHRAKTKVKTDSISIDDVRRLQKRLYETGTGDYCVCIIRSVERMQEAAANAFLKILEEPPEGRVFLLTTQTLSSLLPTIVSRTRRMPFRTVSSKEMKPLLEGVSSEEERFILHLAQGAPGVVATLRRSPDASRTHRLLYTKALSFWRTQSLSERLKLLEPLSERGEGSNQFLLHLALALRESQVPRWKEYEKAFSFLVAGLRTNANRQLMAQRFALTVSKEQKDSVVVSSVEP